MTYSELTLNNISGHDSRVIESGATQNLSSSNAPTLKESLVSLEPSGVWDKSVGLLKGQLDPQIFSAWIKPLTLEKLEVSQELSAGSSPMTEIELSAPNKFCCDHVKRNYESLIAATLTNIIGTANIILRFKVKSAELKGNSALRGSADSAINAVGTVAYNSLKGLKSDISAQVSSSGAANSAGSTLINPPKPRTVRTVDGSNLNTSYNFSNFVVGGCNQFAHAVSLRVSENLGNAYNPLFIYGGVGLGKTHLVNAIGNAARRRGKSVLLVSSEVFVNELIASLRSNKMPQFKSKFRSLDLLMIDDIQFLIGKERTQEEFFHTFNELHQRGKQIILTSDKLPQELIGLEERLRTRFNSGLSADLQAPDFETRVAILAKKSEGANILLPENVARLLAERIDTNVRELEGALNRLHALSSLHGMPISIELAEEALRSFLPERNREVTTEAIQKIVAAKYFVGLNDLIGKRRTQNIAFARHVAMYLCRSLTGSSYPEIGAMFGGRDHSTVIHANRAIDERVKQDHVLRAEIEALKKQLRG